MAQGGDHIAKGKKERKASRPADDVFTDKMERAYQTALNLIGKAKALRVHRAIVRGDNATKLAATYNRFIARVAEELGALTAAPGQQAVDEETPSLSEFLSA